MSFLTANNAAIKLYPEQEALSIEGTDIPCTERHFLDFFKKCHDLHGQKALSFYLKTAPWDNYFNRMKKCHDSGCSAKPWHFFMFHIICLLSFILNDMSRKQSWHFWKMQEKCPYVVFTEKKSLFLHIHIAYTFRSFIIETILILMKGNREAAREGYEQKRLL